MSRRVASDIAGIAPLRTPGVLHTSRMSSNAPHPQQHPYPPAPYGPQGYYPPPPRPYSQLAVSGFIASLIGLGLIGLPVSIAGVVVTQRKPYLRGSALAIIGVVLGIFGAIFNIQVLAAIFSVMDG